MINVVVYIVTTALFGLTQIPRAHLCPESGTDLLTSFLTGRLAQFAPCMQPSRSFSITLTTRQLIYTECHLSHQVQFQTSDRGTPEKSPRYAIAFQTLYSVWRFECAGKYRATILSCAATYLEYRLLVVRYACLWISEELRSRMARNILFAYFQWFCCSNIATCVVV